MQYCYFDNDLAHVWAPEGLHYYRQRRESDGLSGLGAPLPAGVAFDPRKGDITGQGLRAGPALYPLAYTLDGAAVPVPEGPRFEVDLGAVLAVRYAMCRDDSRPGIEVVHVEVVHVETRYIATNGHRLALETRAPIGDLGRYSIPASIAVLARKGDTLTIIGGCAVLALPSGWSACAPLTGDAFPAFERVIPPDPPNVTLGCGAAETLLRACKGHISALPKKPRTIPQARVRANGAVYYEPIPGDGTDMIIPSTCLPGHGPDPEVVVRLNARYLAEGLAHTLPTAAYLAVRPSDAPRYWSPGPVRFDGATGCAVVMPMRD